MHNLVSFLKALSDETRLRIIVLLASKDHCVCELTEILQLSQPKVSKHLTKLRDIGFVKTFRQGQYIFYQLAVREPLILDLLKDIIAHMEAYPILVNDAHRVTQCSVAHKEDKA